MVFLDANPVIYYIEQPPTQGFKPLDSLHLAAAVENEDRRRAMSLNETVIKGTIQPDGTLVLDQKPNLPAGRVTVVLRPEAEPKPPQPLGDDFF